MCPTKAGEQCLCFVRGTFHSASLIWQASVSNRPIASSLSGLSETLYPRVSHIASYDFTYWWFIIQWLWTFHFRKQFLKHGKFIGVFYLDFHLIGEKKQSHSSHLPYEEREREMQYLCNHLFLFVLSYGFSAWNLFQFLYFSKRRLCSTWRLTLPRRWFRRKSDIRSCRNALLVLLITVSFFIQIGYFLSSLLKKSNVSFIKSLTKKTSWSLQNLGHVVHTLFVCFRGSFGVSGTTADASGVIIVDKADSRSGKGAWRLVDI